MHADASQASPFLNAESSRVLMRTDHSLALYDQYPVSKGHALVVPLTPVETIYELPSEAYIDLWETVANVRKQLEEEYHPDGFNIGINEGAAGGQTVSHAHIHVIPRYYGDCPDPRGGIRWMLPHRAIYWQENSSELD